MKQLPAEMNRCPWANLDLHVEYHSQPHSNIRPLLREGRRFDRRRLQNAQPSNSRNHL